MVLPATAVPTTGRFPLALSLVTGAVLSCSSSSSTTPRPTEADASVTCPATPPLTVGQRCAPEGLFCGPQYACGQTTVTLSCTCTRGTFQCTDGAGTPLDPGVTPACPAPTTSGACPATEQSAQLAPCAEPGLVCAYPSSCPNALDSCQCFLGRTAAGQEALRFECTPRICLFRDASATANLPDAATPVSPPEAGARPDSGNTTAASDSGQIPSPGDGALPLDSAGRFETGLPDAQPVDASATD